jgi:hypothetical protein
MAGISAERGYAMLKNGGSFSDYQITCQDKVFFVHRVLLDQASDFFKVVVDKSFKVSDVNY